MVQPRGELDLPQEAIGAERRRKIGMQDLECDVLVVLRILGEVDGRHSAPPKLPVDRVCTRQGIAQSLNWKCTALLQQLPPFWRYVERGICPEFTSAANNSSSVRAGLLVNPSCTGPH